MNTVKNYYKEPENLDRAVVLAKQIFDRRKEYLPSNSYKGFINEGKGDSNDAGHRLRLLHDEFLQDAFKNHCIGTIYRTEKMMNELNPQEQLTVHCEHVIPNSLLTKYIFFQLDNNISEKDFYDFIYCNRVICAVHKTERETELNKKREIDNVLSRWAYSHPNFNTKNAELVNAKSFSEVRPFKRYADTGIKVHCILNENIIDLDCFKMQDHYDIINTHQQQIKKLYDEAIGE